MSEKEEQHLDERWKKFLRKHWKMSILFVIGIVVAAIGAFLVFLWFKDYAKTAIPVPVDLASWSVANIVAFILRLIVWELIIIVIPVIAVVVVIYLLWWRKLPEEEREEYKREPKKRGPRRYTTGSRGGGLFSFLTMIAWLIYIFADGKWNTAISSWSFDYLISSWIWTGIWLLIICGIPIAILVIIWLRYELKEES